LEFRDELLRLAMMAHNAGIHRADEGRPVE